jgi:DnaJ-class molecular chaperone
MEEIRVTANPYDILGVQQAASKAEIVGAVAVAMKSRRYPVKAIAEAQKILMNPQKRLMADFLKPVIPMAQRFRSGQYQALDGPEPELVFLQAFDGLEAALVEARIQERDEAHA